MKAEESWMLPAQPRADNNQLIVEDQQGEEQTTQEENKKHSLNVRCSVYKLQLHF